MRKACLVVLAFAGAWCPPALWAETPCAAILDVKTPAGMNRWGCVSDPAVFEDALKDGWSVRRISSDELADKVAFSRDRFDLLILPCGSYFPAAATNSLTTFLKAGGHLFTTGGYAFDSCYLVNTRRAPKIRDCLRVRDDQIGVFDPSHTLERVAVTTLDAASAGILPPVRIDGPLAGYSAVAMLSTNGHGCGPNRVSWQPVLCCRDAQGGLRGYAGAVAHHVSGTFAGSNWAIFGVTDRDLFAAGSEGAKLIRPIADLLVRELSIGNTTTRWPCYRRGETAEFSAVVRNGAKVSKCGSVRFHAADEAGREAFAACVEFTLAPGTATNLTARWEISETARDYYVIGSDLREGDTLLQREAGGVVIWDDNVIAQGPRLGRDGTHFTIDGRPAFLIGAQSFWGQTSSTTACSPAKFLEDFAEMRKYGLRVTRLFLSMRSEYDFRLADACVQLAQKCGLVLYQTLNVKPTNSSAELAKACEQVAHAARRYRDVPGYMIDIVNEPQAVGAIARKTMDDMRHWATECRRAARKERTDVQVSIGWMQRWGDGGKMFDPPYVSHDLDFTDNHYYGDRSLFTEETKEVDQRALGKPFVVGECGGKCHPTFLAEDPWRMGETREDFARRFAIFTVRTFGMGGAGLLCWHWRDPMEGVFPCGQVRSDGVPRESAALFGRLASAVGDFQFAENRPDVAVILEEAPRWTTNRMKYVRSARRVSRALAYWGANWSVITESDAASLPASVKLRLEPGKLPLGFRETRDEVGRLLKARRCRMTRRAHDPESLETYFVPGGNGAHAWAMVNDSAESVRTERDGFSVTLPPRAAAILSVGPSGKLVRREVFDGADPYGVADWRPSVRWRGFNLTSMLTWRAGRPLPKFDEADFRRISEWGFNFARLPLDYRHWTHGKDWNEIVPDALKPIDEAIAFGRKHGVHVQLCFHRAPGYCINRPELEPASLFKDPEAAEVCARHWAFFARRYRDIPNEALSFNLMNEPNGVAADKYAQVACTLIAAIRREDPQRFICSDGINGGNVPVSNIAGLHGVGQASRGYRPFPLTHYLAPWAGCPDVQPHWPYDPMRPMGTLTGDGKPDMCAPLVIDDVPAGRLQLEIGRVSGKVTLRIEGDGRTLGEIALAPRVDAPEWKDARVFPQWGNLCQATYTPVEEVSIVRPCRRLTIKVVWGDWLQLRGLTLLGTGGRKATLPIACEFRRPVNFHRRFAGWNGALSFVAAGGDAARTYPDDGREYLYLQGQSAWDRLAAQGVWTMVGEFGCYNTVPHDIVLAWTEDNLKLWQERNLGWALWNLRGPFGILDSGRKDVDYEDFEGHKLDRKLLELLQKH